MLRSSFALLTRPVALTTSVALHLGAVVAGGHALWDGQENRADTGAAIEIAVQLLDEPPPPLAPSTPDEEERPATPARPSHAGHRHTYPVPPNHDARPHDPSLVHLASGATPAPSPQPALDVMAPSAETPSAPASALEAPSESPPDFTLPSVGAASRGAAPAGSFIATGASHAHGAGSFDPVFPESAVDTRASLLSSVPVIYPEAARAAGIEVDVLLDLDIDGDGHVTNARARSAPALGLADAALRAVRGYRFTPARRAGRAVAVRMRWTVAFRLQ
ncbi:MAG TPA: TonB family protein [Polyangiaceae bacterium]|nr:TonB family protein [Polyangiaceae bacterium]